MNKQKTPSRGRPVGTKSYAAVGVSELSAMATGGVLPISKKYLKSIGVDISKFSDFVVDGSDHKAHVEIHHEPHNEKQKEPETIAKVIKSKATKSAKAVKTPKAKAKKDESSEESIEFSIQN